MKAKVVKNKLKKFKFNQKQKKISAAILSLIAVTLITIGVITNANATTEVYTKDQLRKAVAATAMSYLYNHNYTDYGQTTMSEISPETTTGTKLISTSLWRNYTVSPEMVNRANEFYIDCTSFVSLVYMNTLTYKNAGDTEETPYDHSKYYKLANNYNGNLLLNSTTSTKYFKGNTYYLANKSAKNFKESIKYSNRAHASGFYHALAADGFNANTETSKAGEIHYNDLATNTSTAVFYYRVNQDLSDTKKKEGVTAAVKTLKTILRKGDILLYRTGGNGHAMLYVGDAINSEKGLIHATGNDYNHDQQGTMTSTNHEDEFSVRYNSLENIVKNKLIDKSSSLTHITVIRPLNDYCNGTADECPVTLSDNIKARTAYDNLKIEQYVRLDKSYNDNLTNASIKSVSTNKALSEYNSVNKGDEITYKLELRNKSEYWTCSTGNGLHNSKEKCTAAEGTWNAPTRSSVTYNNLTVTAPIPNNSEFVKGSCTNCELSDDGKTLTFNVSKIAPTEVVELSYNVKVLNENTNIVNTGMKVSSLEPKLNDPSVKEKVTLTLGKLTTKVNPTFNGINTNLLRERVDEFQGKVSNGYITFSDVATTEENYNVNLSKITSTNKKTMSKAEFVKNIYYNELGLDLSYLTNDNIKKALFNSLNTVYVMQSNGSKTAHSFADNRFFTKKTESEIDELTNTNYKNINKMLVKGMYGGQKLQGNNNLDRLGKLRRFDLEAGDIIVTWNYAATVMKTYLYAGTKMTNGIQTAIIYEFTDTGVKTYHTDDILKDGSSKILDGLYAKSLFAILRPTQVYGTTVKYDYNGATTIGDKSYVARGIYRHLNTPEKSPTTITYNYKGIATNQTATVENTFDAWYADDECAKDSSCTTSKKTNSSSLVSDTVHTLYAGWNAAATLNNKNISGYHNEGWYKDKDLKTKVGNPGETFNPNNLNDSRTITLYANLVKLPTSSITTTATASDITIKITSDGEGFEIYKDDQKITDSTDKTVTIDHDFATTPTTKIYVKPYITVNDKKVYGTVSNTKTINLTVANYTVTFETPIEGIIGTEEVQENKTITGAPGVGYHGYTFLYWTANKDVTLTDGTTIVKDDPITTEQISSIVVTSNIRLDANLEAIEYTVKYQADEHSSISKSEETLYYDNNPTGTTLTVNEGYKFKHWIANKNVTLANGIIIAQGNAISDEQLLQVYIRNDLTFTSVTEIKTYTVKYETDGNATISNESEEVNYDSTISGTNYTLDTGFNFVNWTANKDVTLIDGTTIAQGNAITNEQIKEIKVKSNLTLTLNTEIKTYKITYNAGENGTVTPTEEEINYGAQPTAPELEAAEGYAFVGWQINKNAEYKKITSLDTEDTNTGDEQIEIIQLTAGDVITEDILTKLIVTEDLELTAVYRYNEYHITLSNNGDTEGTTTLYEKFGTGIYLDSQNDQTKMSTMENPIVIPTKYYTLKYENSSLLEEKINLRFDGYYTEENGDGTKLIDANGYITTRFKNNLFNKDTAIYVLWLNSNKKVTLPEPTKEGYEFQGWYLDESYEELAGQANDEYEVLENTTLYAKWGSRPYEVEVEVINGTADKDKQTVNYKEETAFVITGNEGYREPTVSCTNDQQGRIEEDSLIVSNVSNDTKCTVTYNDVDAPTIEISTTNEMKASQTLTVKIKDNVGIKGYYIGTTEPTTETEYVEITNETEKVIEKEITTGGTYYIISKDISNNTSTLETINYYQIKFEVENAEVQQDKILVSKEITLPTPTTEEGYTLLGKWYKDASYQQEVNAYGSKYQPTSNEILYTKATNITYTVTYKTDTNGIISGTIEETINHGSNPTGTTVTAQEGYELEYWTANKDVTLKTGTTIKVGENITDDQLKEIVVKEDIVLTKTTKIKRYKVTYETTEKGTISGIKEEQVNHNGNPQNTIVTAQEGYTFKNWTANKDVTLTDGTTIAKGNPITNEQIVKIKVIEALVITANYEINKYKVSYKTDENATITGQQEETIKHGSNPTGTNIEVKEDYKLLKWTANKDVELKDGTKITAGEKITATQIKEIIVKENIELTATHYKYKYKVTYKTEKEGIELNKTEEEVSEEQTPTEVTVTTKGYKITKWTANKDVKLTTGETIEKGSEITPNQMKTIKITETLELTATIDKENYKVIYTSDKNGKVTGKTEEEKTYEEKATGTTTESNKGYQFQKWIADKDIELEDGTKIEKGSEIKQTQLEKIKVTEDITLTAIHEQIIYKIKYNTGTTDIKLEVSMEDILYGETPTGAAFSGSDKKIENLKWKANKDVKLKNGTVIKAGELMTTAQLKEVVIEDDIEFSIATEEEKTITNVPNTGKAVGILKVLLGIMAILIGVGVVYKETQKNVA